MYACIYSPSTPQLPSCSPFLHIPTGHLNLLPPPSDHAKLLWQRIPPTVKQEHKEISELWEIGKRLWRKEFAAVYELTRNPKWPSHLEPLVTSIVGESESRRYFYRANYYTSVIDLLHVYPLPAIILSCIMNT